MHRVSRETLKNILLYKRFLLQWNKKFNLISRNFTHSILEHIKDSISLVQYVNDLNVSLVDLGSGNGMPGLILSIYGVKNVTLIEASTKKIKFLSKAKKFSQNNVMLLNEFITSKRSLECDILVSRAYGSLEKILKDTQNFLVRDKYLLLKGQNIEKEIAIAKKHWRFNYKIHNIVDRTFTKILELKNISFKYAKV